MLRVRLFRALAFVAWLGTLGAGEFWLLRYQSLPGQLGAGIETWPLDSCIRLAPERFTLLFFIHPRCPCSRASLHELSRIAALSKGTAEIYILLVRPQGAPEDWEPSRIFSEAAAISGAKVLTDTDGLEARRFGAETSGLVLLYDAQGRLSFRGGITARRGHQGDSPGSRALLSRLTGAETGYVANVVFGCPLFDEPSTCDKVDSACTP